MNTIAKDVPKSSRTEIILKQSRNSLTEYFMCFAAAAFSILVFCAVSLTATPVNLLQGTLIIVFVTVLLGLVFFSLGYLPYKKKNALALNSTACDYQIAQSFASSYEAIVSSGDVYHAREPEIDGEWICFDIYDSTGHTTIGRSQGEIQSTSHFFGSTAESYAGEFTSKSISDLDAIDSVLFFVSSTNEKETLRVRVRSRESVQNIIRNMLLRARRRSEWGTHLYSAIDEVDESHILPQESTPMVEIIDRLRLELALPLNDRMHVRIAGPTSTSGTVSLSKITIGGISYLHHPQVLIETIQDSIDTALITSITNLPVEYRRS